MAATTMRSISSITNQIPLDCPEIIFASGDDFYWESTVNTIHHPPISTKEQLYLLLHEIGHANLGHSNYSSGAELLRMERDAWNYATNQLAAKYELDIDALSELAEVALDSYRDWLHRRSTCPECGAVGAEGSKDTFNCLVCHQSWRANEARSCQLRRYQK